MEELSLVHEELDGLHEVQQLAACKSESVWKVRELRQDVMNDTSRDGSCDAMQVRT